MLWTTLRAGYGVRDLGADLMAGLTVAIVALPLAMALAIASGASPDKGLTTAIVAGGLISALGGSRVQIGGPTGAFIVVVAGVIAGHGYSGLLLATLMAGAILVVAGYAGFGRLVRYIPSPVITGFTAGIAVIIATSQIKDVLGLDLAGAPDPSAFLAKMQVYLAHIGGVAPAAAALGAGCLALILGLRHRARGLPAFLIALVAAAMVVWAVSLPVETVGDRFPDIPSALPRPVLPAWSLEQAIALAPSAFTIAFLAGIEALLSAAVADGMTGGRHRSGQELVAQGAANAASALFGGLPATGALARTATNIRAGAVSPMAGVFHAAFVLLFVLVAMDAVAFVPLAALGAVLLIVAWDMSEARHFVHIVRHPGPERLPMLLTFALTVAVDLTVAIAVGVTLASLLFVRDMSRAAQMVPDGPRFREDRDQRAALPTGVEVFRFTGPIFFGMTGTMMEVLHAMGTPPRVLILRMSLVPYIDLPGLRALEEMVAACRKNGGAVILSGPRPEVAQALARAGLRDNGADLRLAPNYRTSVDTAHCLTQPEEPSI